METIGYGFLLGLGILLAVAALAVVVFIVFIMSMFASYMKDRGKGKAENNSNRTDGGYSQN